MKDFLRQRKGSTMGINDGNWLIGGNLQISISDRFIIANPQ